MSFQKNNPKNENVALSNIFVNTLLEKEFNFICSSVVHRNENFYIEPETFTTVNSENQHKTIIKNICAFANNAEVYHVGIIKANLKTQSISVLYYNK